MVNMVQWEVHSADVQGVISSGDTLVALFFS